MRQYRVSKTIIDECNIKFYSEFLLEEFDNANNNDDIYECYLLEKECDCGKCILNTRKVINLNSISGSINRCIEEI